MRQSWPQITILRYISNYCKLLYFNSSSVGTEKIQLRQASEIVFFELVASKLDFIKGEAMSCSKNGV